MPAIQYEISSKSQHLTRTVEGVLVGVVDLLVVSSVRPSLVLFSCLGLCCVLAAKCWATQGKVPSNSKMMPNKDRLQS
jgi:hypothetical protein